MQSYHAEAAQRSQWRSRAIAAIALACGLLLVVAAARTSSGSTTTSTAPVAAAATSPQLLVQSHTQTQAHAQTRSHPQSRSQSEWLPAANPTVLAQKQKAKSKAKSQQLPSKGSGGNKRAKGAERLSDPDASLYDETPPAPLSERAHATAASPPSPTYSMDGPHDSYYPAHPPPQDGDVANVHRARVPDTRRDEEVFDEEHQRTVMRLYGPSQQQEAGAGDSSSEWTDPESNNDWDYAITIDCGSKGSRIHIFKWLHRHSSSSISPFSPLFTKRAWMSSVKPGISSFVDAPEKSISHFRTLLDFAMSSLSEFRYKWHRTPIYVKATAGMRLIKNLPSRDRIMETIRDFLSDPVNSPFYFEKSMARVISGEEEGVYGWMTTNYLTGTLLHASPDTALGVLDLGGASVQITFRPPFDVLGNYFPLRLQQERIRLYTHSFLNFGSSMALQRVNDRIISMGTDEAESIKTPPSGPVPLPEKLLFYLGEQDGVRSFRHPCFPLGYSFTYEFVSTKDLRQSYTGFSSRPWQSDDDGADMSPITTYSAANSQREMVHFSGGGDFANCSAITWQLLHKRAACFDNTCSFDGIYQPRFGNTTFVATSGFMRLTRSLLQLPRNATLEQIDRRSRQVCALTWQQLQDSYRYTAMEELASLCFSARYVFTMLYKGFGFPYRGQNLIFMEELQGLELNWALGSTLYEVQALPWDLDPGCDSYRFRLGIGGSTIMGPVGSPWVGQPIGAEPTPQQLKEQQERRAAEDTAKENQHWNRISDRSLPQPQSQSQSAATPAAPATTEEPAPAPASARTDAPAPPPACTPVDSSSSDAPSSVALSPFMPPPIPPLPPAVPGSPLSEREAAFVWALLGGVVVGWIVTLCAFFMCMRQASRERQRLEQLAVRYEPIRDV